MVTHCGPACTRRRRTRCRTGRHTGVPPFAMTGRNGALSAPKTLLSRRELCGSKGPTVKNVLARLYPLTILFSARLGGRAMTCGSPRRRRIPCLRGVGCWQDSRLLSFTLPQVEILMPTKKPRGQELTVEQHLTTRPCTPSAADRACQQQREALSHCQDRIRLWKQGIRDVVMEICCALHNFRVAPHPVATYGLSKLNLNILVRWHGFQPYASGFVPLSMAEFSL